MENNGNIQSIEPTGLKAPIILHLGREIDEELRYFLLGQVLKRIRRFCERYDTDGDGRVLVRDVERDFVRDGEREFLILVAVRDAGVVGHLLANTYHYHGRLYIYVSQLELDQGSGVGLEDEKKAFEHVRNWKQQLGAHGIRATAPTREDIRRLSVFHGFIPALTTMKWEGR